MSMKKAILVPMPRGRPGQSIDRSGEGVDDQHTRRPQKRHRGEHPKIRQCRQEFIAGMLSIGGGRPADGPLRSSAGQWTTYRPVHRLPRAILIRRRARSQAAVPTLSSSFHRPKARAESKGRERATYDQARRLPRGESGSAGFGLF